MQKQRDPALLEEVAPGLLRLLLFPLANDLPPMKVSVGFTVPLRWAGDTTTLHLPRIVDHNCRRSRVTTHERTLHGADGAVLATDSLDDAALRQPLSLPRGRAVSWSRDAEGLVVQRMTPRAPIAAAEAALVVVDACCRRWHLLSDYRRLCCIQNHSGWQLWYRWSWFHFLCRCSQWHRHWIWSLPS